MISVNPMLPIRIINSGCIHVTFTTLLHVVTKYGNVDICVKIDYALISCSPLGVVDINPENTVEIVKMLRSGLEDIYL